MHIETCLIIKNNKMKKIKFSKLEKLEGGKMSTLCILLGLSGGILSMGGLGWSGVNENLISACWGS
jgi:hypothetical protein